MVVAPPSMKLLLPEKTGLSSCKKLKEVVSKDVIGEKKLGDMGGRDAGIGDSIPGKEAARSTTGPPPSMSKFSSASRPELRSRSPSDERADFSKVARRAAGESAPPP